MLGEGGRGSGAKAVTESKLPTHVKRQMCLHIYNFSTSISRWKAETGEFSKSSWTSQAGICCPETKQTLPHGGRENRLPKVDLRPPHKCRGM